MNTRNVTTTIATFRIKTNCKTLCRFGGGSLMIMPVGANNAEDGRPDWNDWLA